MADSNTKATSSATESVPAGEGSSDNHHLSNMGSLVDVNAGKSTTVDKLSQLRRAIDQYENVVVDRARPGVLASRRACLDAHEWTRIGPESPLLMKRQMTVVYDEVADRIVG